MLLFYLEIKRQKVMHIPVVGEDTGGGQQRIPVVSLDMAADHYSRLRFVF